MPVLKWSSVAVTAVVSILFLFFGLRLIFANCLILDEYAGSDAEKYFCLPYNGTNYSANSSAGYALGRYYLKGKAAATVVYAYALLADKMPESFFLYGEMGWKGGGNFPPHRTHKNGLSADFITPVKLAANKTGHLPCNPGNLWGYGIRLDANGRYENYRLDTTALIEHLAALVKAGASYGLKIKLVILDPPLVKLLKKDPSFSKISKLNFMSKAAWFPHDGHYHVDFTEK